MCLRFSRRSTTLHLFIKFYKDRVNSEVLKYSFANRVIEQWNKQRVISASSINSIKKIDKYLREK